MTISTQSKSWFLAMYLEAGGNDASVPKDSIQPKFAVALGRLWG